MKMIKTMLPGNALIICTMLLIKFPIQLLQPIFLTVLDRQKPHRLGQSATLPLQMIDLVALRRHRMTNASISFAQRFVKGSKNTCRRKRRMTSHLHRRASSRRKSRFRLRRCRRRRLSLSDRRRVPQERSALQQHPVPKHPHLELPNPRRQMKGATQLGAQRPQEKHLPKQKNFSRMQMLLRKFSLSLNRKLRRLNGINVLLDLNAVKTLKRVMPKMQCFGATPVALHIALIAVSKAWHVTITSSTILRKFPQIFCQTALVQKILLLMLEPLLILFLLIPHTLEPQEVNKLKRGKKTMRTLFVIWKMARNLETPTCRVLWSMESKITTILDLSTSFQVAIECPLCRNIFLMRKMKQPCQFGGLKSFSSILTAETWQRRRLKDCLSFSVAAFWVSVPSKEWQCVTSKTSTTPKRILISSVF